MKLVQSSMHRSPTIVLATRGSALALAQAEMVLNECRAAFPDLRFDVKVIRTTGDKLETASLSQGGKGLPKGLFTKELEVALLDGQADFAVHSLKDLPTALPAGLKSWRCQPARGRPRRFDLFRQRTAKLGENSLPAKFA